MARRRRFTLISFIIALTSVVVVEAEPPVVGGGYPSGGGYGYGGYYYPKPTTTTTTTTTTPEPAIEEELDIGGTGNQPPPPAPIGPEREAELPVEPPPSPKPEEIGVKWSLQFSPIPRNTQRIKLGGWGRVLFLTGSDGQIIPMTIHMDEKSVTINNPGGPVTAAASTGDDDGHFAAAAAAADADYTGNHHHEIDPDELAALEKELLESAATASASANPSQQQSAQVNFEDEEPAAVARAADVTSVRSGRPQGQQGRDSAHSEFIVNRNTLSPHVVRTTTTTAAPTTTRRSTTTTPAPSADLENELVPPSSDIAYPTERYPSDKEAVTVDSYLPVDDDNHSKGKAPPANYYLPAPVVPKYEAPVVTYGPPPPVAVAVAPPLYVSPVKKYYKVVYHRPLYHHKPLLPHYHQKPLLHHPYDHPHHHHHVHSNIAQLASNLADASPYPLANPYYSGYHYNHHRHHPHSTIDQLLASGSSNIEERAPIPPLSATNHEVLRAPMVMHFSTMDD